MNHTITEMKEALLVLAGEYKDLRIECNEALDDSIREQLLVLLELNMGEISKLERDIQYFEGLYINH